MADILMFNHNGETQNNPSVDKNAWMFEHNESTNQNLLNSPKFFSQRIRKRYYKTLGTSVINSPISPPWVLQICQ